ncbi:sister chromatid cohesion protein DCC1-like isoform X2 [Rhopilema esculentum]
MEKVNKIADIAGLSRRKGVVQSLTFTSDLSAAEFKLFELPKELVDVVKEGECVTLRGDPNEEAVLCTKNASYEVRAADTSNALLLLPAMITSKSPEFSNEPELKDVEVVSSISSYYELKRIKPKLSKLRKLLEESKFEGLEKEESKIDNKLNLHDLLTCIQASEEEIHQGLADIGAFSFNGYWRLLDVSYKEKAFSQILKLLDEEGWEFEEIPLVRTCEILEELYPREILKHCLDLYGEKIEYRDNPQVYYRLIEDKVCQFFAECILRGAERFNHHEFFEAWQQSVPDGMQTNKEQLKGLALEDMTSQPPVIWYFPVSDLPDEPLARFNKLFKVRSKWTREDIEPYISDLCTPTQSMNALLLKFTRCSTDSLGSKIYNSKRPIS